MNTFISDYMENWLEQNPTATNLFLIMGWMVNHPIFTFSIFIFSLVVIWKIVKGLDKLLEITGLSVLKVVFNFIWRIVKSILVAIAKVTGWGWEKLLVRSDEPSEQLAIAPVETVEPIPLEVQKQQRLQEIQNRLAALTQEQNELLAEASKLLSNEPLDVVESEIVA
jgi:hypothetical protein